MLEDSPASAAGLERYSDYLLGTPERVFRGTSGCFCLSFVFRVVDVDDFHEEIMDSIDVPLQCYVYKCVILDFCCIYVFVVRKRIKFV